MEKDREMDQWPAPLDPPAENEPAEEEEKTGKLVRRELKEWVKDIGIATGLAIIVMLFIKPTVVKESSMEPTFNENDYLFVSKQSYKLLGGEPERGDVVVFHSNLQTSEGKEKLLIKRVIGIPGDVIDIKDGKVYVNKTELDDSYTKDGFTNGSIEDLVVPEDRYFCLGDNRRVSVDSRSPDVGEMGFVPKDWIVGKVIFRLLPFSDFGTIDNPFEE